MLLLNTMAGIVTSIVYGALRGTRCAGTGALSGVTAPRAPPPRALVLASTSSVPCATATLLVADWHDDGPDPTNCEDNFGSVFHNATGNPAQPYAPKPFYTAVATLQATVGNAAAFSQRVQPAAVAPAAGPTGGDPVPDDVFVLGE